MRKEGFILSVIVLFSLFAIQGIHAATSCNPKVSLVNQDPYPAVPGDQTKLVFQIDGVQNPECGNFQFQLIPKYPISLMPGQQTAYNFTGGIFQKDYQSFFLAPYNILVSPNALDGNNSIEVQYKYGNNAYWESQEFQLDVQDVRATFELYVKNYDPTTKTFTLEILNTAKSNSKAVTLEIPQQNNIKLEGSNVNVVGDLDSNDYTTADFQAVPMAGNITIKIIYTDLINERRTETSSINFNPAYFEGNSKKNGPSTSTIILYLVILGIIVYYFYSRHKKKKAMKAKLSRK